MNERGSFERSHERAFSVALLHLNALIESGRDEEAEGDAVRDEMDMHWYRMDERQRERMDYLSVDLEDLAQAKGKPIHVGPIDRKWAEEMRSARDVAGVEGADRILALLRDPRAGRPSGNIAFIQARIFERLGMPEVAFRFFEAAEDRDPTFAIVTLIFVRQQGWMHLAMPRAERLLAGRTQDQTAVFFACSVLLETVRNADPISAQVTFERIRHHMSKCVSAIEQVSPPNADVVELHPVAVVLLGTCLNRLGDAQGAIKVYDRYLEKYRLVAADIFGLRGSAKIGHDPQGANRDFKTAVDLGTSSAWPFLYLAQHELQSGKPLNAIRLCNQALNFLSGIPDVVQSLLLECLAIGMAHIGQPKQWILETFDRAIDLSPENPRLKQNRDIAAGDLNSEMSRLIQQDASCDVKRDTVASNSILKLTDHFATRTSQIYEAAGLRSVA